MAKRGARRGRGNVRPSRKGAAKRGSSGKSRKVVQSRKRSAETPLRKTVGWVAAVLAVAGLAAAAYLHQRPWFDLVMGNYTVQMAFVGAVSGLAYYVNTLPDSQPIRPGSAARKLTSGSVFGILAAKTGAGLGLNESLQLASAGLGGAKGSSYMDSALDRLLKR